MIRLGICSAPENAVLIHQLGFDYLEVNLVQMHNLSEEEFARRRELLLSSGLPCEAANCMLPGNLPVTGPEVDENRIREYLGKALARAAMLGIQVICFGSGMARGVPEGFPQEEAWRQIARFLTITEEYASEYGIEIAIEPLRAAECNILNFVSEATLMASLLHLPHIGALGDTHHMLCGNEPFSALTRAGSLLKHVHISHSMGNEGGRDFPSAEDGNDYPAVFRALKEAGYRRRISIEADCRDLETDGAKAFALLNALRNAE